MADVQEYTILILIWLISFIVVRALLTKYRTRMRSPPGPLALPIIGHFHLLGSKPHQSFHKLSLRYGPLFQFFLGSIPCVVVSSPQMAREFLQTHDISFANRPKFGKAREEERRKKRDLNDGGDTMNDFLDILLDIMEDEEEEMRLTRENVKAITQVINSHFCLFHKQNIFGGGMDTSVAAAVWAVAELINHPNIMEKARQEIDSVVGKDRLVEESDMANHPYLQAIVKETLRLHPPGALFVRESTEDCGVGGYHIPAKTQLFVNNWENPLEFWPERFLREDGSLKSQLDVRGQHFRLLLFGSGRRICPGISLALQFIHTSLATMIQCFEWRVGDGGNGNVDMEEGPNAILAHPLICVPVVPFNPFPNSTM